MTELSNKIINISINEIGAEIRKLTVNDKDRFWCGDGNIWGGVAPVLFPICSLLKNDEYTYNGKSYTLEKHGFARKMQFNLINKTNNMAEFSLKSNEETLKKYPWEFELIIRYEIIDNKLNVTYKVKNNSKNEMYFSIGSHEAYSCDGNIENYDILFPFNEDFIHQDVDKNGRTGITDVIAKNTNQLSIYRKYFEKDALVFMNLKSKQATLKNRKTDEKTTVIFPDNDYLLIWTTNNNGGGDYICIEPWSGIPAHENSSSDITKKEGVIALTPNDEYINKHCIIFE